jgi:hypothetical protein
MSRWSAYTCGALLLGCLAGFAGGEEPAGTDDRVPLLPVPPLVPSTPAPAPAGPDAVWKGLIGNQQAYQAGVNPPLRPTRVVDESALHVYANAGFYYIKPHLDNNPVFTITRQPAGGGGGAATTQTDHFDFRTDFCPRISGGVISDSGWGTRVDWFLFDHGADSRMLSSTDSTLATAVSSAPVFGVPGFTSPGSVARQFKVFNDRLAFTDDLRLYTLDWELTRELRLGAWRLLAAGGVIYGNIVADYTATRVNAGTSQQGTTKVVLQEDSDTVLAGHNFGGVGPVGGLDVRRPLGGSGLALYGSVNAFCLFGDEKLDNYQQNTQQRQTTPAGGKTTQSTVIVISHGEVGRHDSRPVGELELGLEWARAVGPVQVFLRTGLTAQKWFDSGSATVEDGDLTFFGLTLTGGISY